MAETSTAGADGPLSALELRSIPAERYDDVIKHLRANFFADEPLNRAVALCRPGEGHAELEAHSLSTLKDGLSVMAVTADTDEVLKEDATGLFSQRVAESVGLKCVREVRYSEYVAGDTGEVVFKPPEPHDCLKIMVKVL